MIQRKINIVSWLTDAIALVAWIAVLVRILYYKTKLWGLVLICSLMIVSQITLIILFQVDYSADLMRYNETSFNEKLYLVLGQAAQAFNFATFNEAHWLFAFNYWAFSYRV